MGNFPHGILDLLSLKMGSSDTVGISGLINPQLEDVYLVEFMYLVYACQVRFTIGDSELCCCTCVTYFKS